MIGCSSENKHSKVHFQPLESLSWAAYPLGVALELTLANKSAAHPDAELGIEIALMIDYNEVKSESGTVPYVGLVPPPRGGFSSTAKTLFRLALLAVYSLLRFLRFLVLPTSLGQSWCGDKHGEMQHKRLSQPIE